MGTGAPSYPKEEKRDFSGRSFMHVPSVSNQTPVKNRRSLPVNDRGDIVRTRKQLRRVGPKFSGGLKDFRPWLKAYENPAEYFQFRKGLESAYPVSVRDFRDHDLLLQSHSVESVTQLRDAWYSLTNICDNLFFKDLVYSHVSPSEAFVAVIGQYTPPSLVSDCALKK